MFMAGEKPEMFISPEMGFEEGESSEPGGSGV
jgi:hypothetical protein